MKTELTKESKLTTSSVVYWENWYEHKFIPALTPLSKLSEVGNYLVIEEINGFESLSYRCNLRRLKIDKISKLKVGSEYRSSAQGWVIPESLVELVEETQDCIEFAKKLVELRRNAIDLIDQLGFERIKSLSPEKMEQLIALFADA